MPEKKYTLIKTKTNRKDFNYLYQVKDEEGNVVSERRSNRDYIACTINGQYYFGRLDLIGKGDHGRACNFRSKQVGQEHLVEGITTIAYLKTEEDGNMVGDRGNPE
jgi:hypothetical protein